MDLSYIVRIVPALLRGAGVTLALFALVFPLSLPLGFLITPSIGNEAITLVKDTALVASIALPELLHYAKGIVTRDFTTTPFIVAAFIYLLITFVVTVLFKFAERKTNYE